MASLTFLDTAGVRSLDTHSVLRVHGDDARTWLNGQITNDVRNTTKGQSVYALVVNLKGRVVADLWVLDDGEDFLLVLPTSALEKVRTQFEKYIIMEDVTLSVEEDTRVITVQGARAKELVANANLTAPTYPADRLHAEGIDVLVTKNEHDEVLARLSKHAVLLDATTWENARIESMRPAFGADFGEKTYPQEAGLEHRAVSFNKGCYLGQEVVCMLENRGQLTRRLVSLVLDGASGASVAPGMQLTSASGEAAGEVTSISPDHSHALAIVRRVVATEGTSLNAGSAKGTITRLL